MTSAPAAAPSVRRSYSTFRFMKIGILGGGQLGRMTALAGYPLGASSTVLEPATGSSAAQVCARVAPEVFSVDADGNSDVLLDQVPPELRLKAMLAMRQCPTNAISVWEEEEAADPK